MVKRQKEAIKSYMQHGIIEKLARDLEMSKSSATYFITRNLTKIIKSEIWNQNK